MKKKLLYVIFGVLIIASLGVIFRSQIQATFFPIKEIHIHAGFQVYENGKEKSFADIRYMKDDPCGSHEVGKVVNEQLEKAHMHELVDDVVHVHREGATWGDFFTNIKYPVDGSKAEAYINEKKVENILAEEIRPYDRVVIFIGEREKDLKPYFEKQVAKEHIIKTEKRSEQCGATHNETTK